MCVLISWLQVVLVIEKGMENMQVDFIGEEMRVECDLKNCDKLWNELFDLLKARQWRD